MGNNDLSETLKGLSPDLKKEILQNLVTSLLDGLNEEEQKDILQSALQTPKENRELIDMVDAGIVDSLHMLKTVVRTAIRGAALALTIDVIVHTDKRDISVNPEG